MFKSHSFLCGMTMNLCKCGCGIKVKNRYKLGHNRRSLIPINKILCKCGCGLLINDRNRNGLIFYKSGHNNKKTSTIEHRYVRADGYVMIFKPDHPGCNSRGYVLEHRLIMENKLGRYLTKDEDVHHVNGVRSDNREENLILITHNEHTKLHWESGKIHKWLK